MSEYSSNELREGIKKIILSNCYKSVFSVCSISWSSPMLNNPETVTIDCTDQAGKNTSSEPLLPFFDLASLTKPLVTLLCIITLVDRKIVKLHDSLESLLDQKIPSDWCSVTLEQLLSHSSGLPAHVEYWRELINENENDRRKLVIDRILSEKKGIENNHVYSDLGYILLGFIIEHKSGKSLDDFWDKEIARPLGIETVINFPRKLKFDEKSYVKTGKSPWSNKTLQGIVHDDNCRALGGVCGHAGLFGTAPGVLSLCQELLFHLKDNNNRLPFTHETFLHCCTRVADSEWTLGFNLPSPAESSSGSFFSQNSLGHLGFTGTSFWIDPVSDLIVVLLSNRVFMGNNRRGIKELRPAVHDFLAQRLGIKNRHTSDV